MTNRLKAIKTDEEVLSAYREKGDPELVGELFNRYMHLVYGLCLKYLKNRDDSQDAVMNIYEIVAQKLLTAEVTYFKSWLYTVSKNHCLMELRKKKPETTTELFMESAIDVHPNEETDELEHHLDALAYCVEQLKKEQKACVKLFFLEKNSYLQVQEQTGLQLKKVKSHIQNGKRNLKICLERRHVEH